MNKRIDVLILYDDDYDEEYDNEGEVVEDVDEVHETDYYHDIGTNEPPCKTHETGSSSEESRFFYINKRFRSDQRCSKN